MGSTIWTPNQQIDVIQMVDRNIQLSTYLINVFLFLLSGIWDSYTLEEGNFKN